MSFLLYFLSGSPQAGIKHDAYNQLENYRNDDQQQELVRKLEFDLHKGRIPAVALYNTDLSAQF